MADLNDVEHLLVLLAEDVPADSVGALPEHVTVCRNYHLTPAGEDRAERVWPSFAVLLREAPATLLDGRPILAALVLPLLVVAALRRRRWRGDLPISRQAAFHGATLLIGGTFLFGVGMAVGNWVGGQLADSHAYRGLVVGYGAVLAILVVLAIIVAFFTIFGIATAFPACIFSESTQQFASISGNAVDSAGVNFDAAVQCATRFLEIDAITFFKQRHLMEVINQRKVPRVVGIDFLFQAVSI